MIMYSFHIKEKLAKFINNEICRNCDKKDICKKEYSKCKETTNLLKETTNEFKRYEKRILKEELKQLNVLISENVIDEILDIKNNTPDLYNKYINKFNYFKDEYELIAINNNSLTVIRINALLGAETLTYKNILIEQNLREFFSYMESFVI